VNRFGGEELFGECRQKGLEPLFLAMSVVGVELFDNDCM